MRVSGFSFIRNGSRLNYPFIESIRSALPICDEFVIAVGAGDDDTRERIVAIGDPKIRIIDTVWNPILKEKGFVLAQQKLTALYNCTGDWAFYIEGDEVLHEEDQAAVLAAMERHVDDPRVEALWFDYVHFYGDPNWVARGHSYYPREARIIRNTIRITTTDSLYFVVLDHKKSGRYPRAASADARLFHYGNCRSPIAMWEKRRAMQKLYATGHEGEAAPAENFGRQQAYTMDARLVGRFEDTHPAVMADWIAAQEGDPYVPFQRGHLTGRERRNLLGLQIGNLLPIDFGKKHYKPI
jgi:hypothetical protein